MHKEEGKVGAISGPGWRYRGQHLLRGNKNERVLKESVGCTVWVRVAQRGSPEKVVAQAAGR